MQNKTTNLFSKYLNQFQKDPTSKVFAPLAESYRKLGMMEEAIETLKAGLKYHRDYQLAYIIYAHCYFDLGKYDQAYNLLKPLVEINLDNIRVQQLFANICYKLHYYHEALQAFKYVLFLNPNDSKAAERVKELEDSEKVIAKPQEEKVIQKFREEIKEAQNDDSVDNWESVNLVGKNESSLEQEPTQVVESSDFDQWEMNKGSDEEEIEENLREESEFLDEFEQEDDDDDVFAPVGEGEALEDEGPLVTQTLVDIYIAQKHFDKAEELLRKIVQKDPSDKKAQAKLQRVLAYQSDEDITESSYSEDPRPPKKSQKVEKAYHLFLEKIIERSEQLTKTA
ncbi:MAG: tetratricopeptide repeat protein [Halobacteriovoraceae bacterium]|nr:tetratricopeptide repeat protein [Halobacteriovoraceae bacterium]